jgi:methylaspartate ammonia-lyase
MNIDFDERAKWLADRMVLAGGDIQERRVAIIEAYLKTLAQEVLQAQRLVLSGPCDCGFAKVEMPDYLDSGTTLDCLGCGAEIVIDVWTPEVRTKFFEVYAKGLLHVEAE